MVALGMTRGMHLEVLGSNPAQLILGKMFLFSPPPARPKYGHWKAWLDLPSYMFYLMDKGAPHEGVVLSYMLCACLFSMFCPMSRGFPHTGVSLGPAIHMLQTLCWEDTPLCARATVGT
jgi:hypothetical protein